MNKWDAATIWKNRKSSITYPVNDLTVAASITVLKNLEGHIIYYGNSNNNYYYQFN